MKKSRPAGIAELMRRQALQDPDRLALVSPGGRLTFAELEQKSGRYAALLHRLGIRDGVRAVLMVRPGPEFLALSFGLLQAGAVLVLIDPGMGWKNLGRCLREARPSAFIGIPIAQAARVLFGWGRKTIHEAIRVGGNSLWPGRSLHSLLCMEAEPAPRLNPAPDQTAALVFTSGSTGPPKGVLYTHRMFAAQVAMLAREFGIQPGEADLATFPLFGIFDPALGVTAVFPEMDFSRPARVDPHRILGALRESGATHMFGSPALLNRVGRFCVREGVRLRGLKRVLSAGAPVSPEIRERICSVLDREAQLHTPYGATEALPVCSISSSELRQLEAGGGGRGICVGRPLAGVQLWIIRISDQEIHSWSEQLLVPDGTVGELVVAGENVSSGYFGRPEADRLAKIFGPDGTLRHRMGDLGYRDSEGRIWFCGRKAHRVTTPEGVLFSVVCEQIYNSHPAVFRSALVGLGEPPQQRPVLCIELEEGRKPTRQLACRILELGVDLPETRGIDTLLFHPAFPVDIRHNAKIFREKLARWAARRMR